MCALGHWLRPVAPTEAGFPTSPNASANVAGLTSTTPGTQGAAATGGRLLSERAKWRFFTLQKTVPENTGQPGSFCRITSSNIEAIEVGSKIIYATGGLNTTVLDSDIVLDLPGSWQQQGLRPLQTRSCETGRDVHILWRDREVHSL